MAHADLTAAELFDAAVSYSRRRGKLKAETDADPGKSRSTGQTFVLAAADDRVIDRIPLDKLYQDAEKMQDIGLPDAAKDWGALPVVGKAALIFVFSGLLLNFCLSGEPSLTPEQKAQKEAQEKKSSSDYPMMLATIDGNDGDPLKVNRYRSLLGQLDDSFVETPEQIADMSANTKAELGKEGIAESVLPIMETMNTILPVPVANQKYAEYTAAYMTLRIKGQTHEQATSGLRALLASITSKP
jgi:hypothetical protein